MTPSPDPAPAPLHAMGIVGGGQLAWMLAEAAADLGVSLHVQTPRGDDPAARRATTVLEAPLDDVAATRQLAERCGAVSFENEWIPLEALAPLIQEGVRFVPSLQALRPLIDKRSQHQLLQSLHLPTPRWCPLEEVLHPPSTREKGAGDDARVLNADSSTGDDLDPQTGLLLQGQEATSSPRLPDGLDFPVMAKAATGGYDGRGTRLLQNQGDLEALLTEVDPTGWLLEERVNFELELALVACRNREGELRLFPLVQTHQHQHVCDWVLYPAPVDHAVEAFARNVAASLLTALDYVGVLSIEFFYGPAGLQINELAPRTHNSGHLTIEACQTSQFEQQVRIVTGRPMGSTEARVPGALMINLLSPEEPLAADQVEERCRRLRELPGAHLHWYGKSGHRPGRKLGHLTVALPEGGGAAHDQEWERWLQQVREIWPLPQTSTAGASP
ncbi:MAG: 5-(carboxyamino)imidazole ribonucleotide synthase [Synechococcus sp. ELA057]